MKHKSKNTGFALPDLPLPTSTLWICSKQVNEPSAEFSWKIYERRFSRPLRTAHGVWSVRRGVILRVIRSDGAVGFGEIAPIPWFGTETLEAAVDVCRSMEGTGPEGRLLSIPNQYPCCQFAVESALDMAMGKSPEGNTSELGNTALVSGESVSEEEIEKALGAGFRTLKLKIAVASFDEEMATVRRLAGMLPADVRLRLDANGGLSVHDAERWLRVVVDLPVEFIEQPLPVPSHQELMALACDFPDLIALDESVRSVDDLKRWRDRDWRGAFVLKPAIAGKLSDLRSELRQGPGAFVFSSSLETAVGRDAALAPAFEFSNGRAVGFGVSGLFDKDGFGDDTDHARLERLELPARLNTGETIWNLLKSN